MSKDSGQTDFPVSLSHRAWVLREAETLVDGERNASYGDPIQDFQRTGSYWNIHIAGIMHRRLSKSGYMQDDKVSVEHLIELLLDLIEPHDVAIMMTQLKLSRLAWSPEKPDHWVDAAGYAACGYDCSVREGML